MCAMAEHDVVIVGAGPAGLAVAAMLARRGVAAVIIEQDDDLGARWSRRYEGLRLNSARWLSSLPGYPLPREYGQWVQRDSFVRYLHDYASYHRLDIQLGTEVHALRRSSLRWLLMTNRGELSAHEVIIATGANAEPYVPDWPGRAGFQGRLLHSFAYRTPQSFRAEDVLVVGCGNSGAEIAVELANGGAARVRLAVRSAPQIVPAMILGVPPQLIARALCRLPSQWADRTASSIARMWFGNLSRHWAHSQNGPGIYTLNSRVGRQPLFERGLVRALDAGAVEVVPAVQAFDGQNVLVSGGLALRPSTVIAATGYVPGLKGLVGHLGILDSRGRPLHPGPPLKGRAPNLHFIGYRNVLTGTLRQIGIEAAAIASAIGRRPAIQGRPI